MTEKQLTREARRLQPQDTDYCGSFDTVAEFARESSISCDDCPADLPAHIMDNIDWTAVGERLLVQDYTCQPGKTKTHYYRIN